MKIRWRSRTSGGKPSLGAHQYVQGVWGCRVFAYVSQWNLFLFFSSQSSLSVMVEDRKCIKLKLDAEAKEQEPVSTWVRPCLIPSWFVISDAFLKPSVSDSPLLEHNAILLTRKKSVIQRRYRCRRLFVHLTCGPRWPVLLPIFPSAELLQVSGFSASFQDLPWLGDLTAGTVGARGLLVLHWRWVTWAHFVRMLQAAMRLMRAAECPNALLPRSLGVVACGQRSYAPHPCKDRRHHPRICGRQEGSLCGQLRKKLRYSASFYVLICWNENCRRDKKTGKRSVFHQ